MTLLESLIDEIKKENPDKSTSQVVLEICEKIYQEEKEKSIYINYQISGPNVFLCLEVPPINNKMINFLTLNRLDDESFTSVLWGIYMVEILDSSSNNHTVRKLRTVEIKEVVPKKIMKEFLKNYIYYLGKKSIN